MKPPELKLRVQLLGGRAAGGTVTLTETAPTIHVFQNGGPPYAVPGDAGAPDSERVALGTYELVGPIGPETPTYVARPE